MKRVKECFLILLAILLLNGCVKQDITMSIDKDKSMNFEMKFLVNEALLGENSSDLSAGAKELEDKGFTVTIKNEGNYRGYLVTKKYQNIDELSNNNGEVINLDNITDNDFDMSKLFKLEKGFLKNTYTANFVFEFNQSNFNTETEESENGLIINDDEVVTTNEPEQTETEVNDDENTIDLTEDSDFSNIADLTALANEMEFKYIVNLPYKASSNNATSVNGNTLTWNLTTQNKNEIKYSFPIYNLTNILIVGGCLLLVVIVLIVILIKRKKKKSESETLIHKDYDESIVGQISETQTPIENIPTKGENLEYTMPGITQVNTETINSEETVLASNQDDISAQSSLAATPASNITPTPQVTPIVQPTPVVEQTAQVQSIQPPLSPTIEPQAPTISQNIDIH